MYKRQVECKDIEVEAILCIAEAYPDGMQYKDKGGNLPLHSAIERSPHHNKLEEMPPHVVQKLLNYYTGACTTKDRDGNTPLHSAVEILRKNKVEVVKMLLENGADIHKAAFGEVTPLYIASENGHKEVVEVLLKHGADINRAQSQGATALSIASQKGHKEVVKALLDLGADPTLATIEGTTPLQTAKDNNHLEIVALLEAALRDL